MVNGFKQQYGRVATRLLFVSLLISFTSHISYAQIDFQHDDKAEKSPSQLKLLIFSGSDWCLPCIRFERKVLQDTAFIAFGDKYLLIEKADFPQHKKLSKRTGSA